MVRILHCSDLHLEHRFGGAWITAGEARRRREELRSALRRIVDLAIDRHVDALTVAGDLYEHEHATEDTGGFLAREFRRLGQTPALIAPGNHDPYVPGSLYDRVAWPDNVTVFDSERWRPVGVSRDVVVWGVGHDGPSMRRNRLRELRAHGTVTGIALFHGADLSRPVPQDADHCGFQPADMERAGVAFALLGHEHTWRRSDRFAYPGSPEPLAFFTEGPHFALVATVQQRSVAVEPLTVSRVRYRTECIDAGQFASSQSLLGALRGLVGRCAPHEIVRIVLTGTRPHWLRRDLERVTRTLAGGLRYVEVLDETERAGTRRLWTASESLSSTHLPERAAFV